jgi:sugar phosphate isomerase/epimerase
MHAYVEYAYLQVRVLFVLELLAQESAFSMWNVTLSTMWAINRFSDLDQFFSAAGDFGLERFELNHQVNSQMLGAIELDGRQVTGVHAPCPADTPAATVKARNWLISSPHAEGRRQGVLAVQRSIDLAQELGAGLVVVHAGRVDVDAALEARLWGLYETGKIATVEYASLKETLMIARAEKAPANLDAARQSIAELAAYAARAGIHLGLENRYHYLDVPLPDEMEDLLAIAGEEQASFLYDVGHAQTLENLGFVRHREWLERYANRMVGVHLHDIKGIRDHFAAGLGEVDWDMVARYLPRKALRTLEFHARNTPDQLETALKFLASKDCIEHSTSE